VVVFVATLIRSAFGFGEALIAVPLLAFVIPLKVAVPLAVLVSITVAAIVVLQDWRHVHFRSAGWLVVATLPGIPLGLLLLTSRHQAFVTAGRVAQASPMQWVPRPSPVLRRAGTDAICTRRLSRHPRRKRNLPPAFVDTNPSGFIQPIESITAPAPLLGRSD